MQNRRAYRNRYQADTQLDRQQGLSVSHRVISSRFPLHWHDFFEMEFILDGSGEQILNGELYPLKRGDVYLLGPTDFHEVRPVQQLECINLMIHERLLTQQMLSLFMQAKENLLFHLEGKQFEAVCSLAFLLLQEFEADRPHKQDFIQHLLCCLFLTVEREMGASSLGKPRKMEDSIQRALAYLHLHFRENPSLQQTAQAVWLNPNYFCTRFHEAVGMTYKRYMTELKVSSAKKLLTSSDLSVTEICFASGFSSLASFQRVFKAVCAVSPVAYRRQTQNCIAK